MLTFEDLMRDAARNGDVINLMFEQRLFDLVGTLQKVSEALEGAEIPHELVGGLAVLVHVEEADPSLSMLTRDVNVMVCRPDLDRAIGAAVSSGFRFRHSAGLDMLLYGETQSARNAVHLIFSGEKVKASQALVNPPINPIRKSIYGRDVLVIPVPDLVRMKLASYRLKDQVHIQVMDAAGLITAEVKAALTDELRDRLQHVRASD